MSRATQIGREARTLHPFRSLPNTRSRVYKLFSMIRFSEIDDCVGARPGVYEIHTVDGVLLKVGIGANLLRRLRSHRASRQSGLRTTLGDPRLVTSPSEIASKASILAKHLFFDRELAPEYDLRSEQGRRDFLEAKCRIVIQYCADIGEARRIERSREQSATFRYCRHVTVYPVPTRSSLMSH